MGNTQKENIMETTYWAQTHNTDERIAEAIGYLADGDTNIAERIFQDPTDGEIIAIYERATNGGLEDENEMRWGLVTLADMLAKVDECDICGAAGLYMPATQHTADFDLCDDCYAEFRNQMVFED
jgi:hypothetical protein